MLTRQLLAKGFVGVAAGLMIAALLPLLGCDHRHPPVPGPPTMRAEVLPPSSVSTSAPTEPAAYKARVIRMTAGRYDFSPKQVVVTESEMVRLVPLNRDVIHRFQLKDFGIDVALSANSTHTVDVIAEHPGIYRFVWADYDGLTADEMAGELIVQPLGG